MSFLNALASDGLSVGLRFYAAKINRASEVAATAVTRPEEEQQTSRMAEAERLSKPAPPPPPPLPKEQSPEEMAAGRAEANAILAADGSLGVLQASETAQMFTAGEEAAGGAVLNGELAAGDQIAGAKAAENSGEPEDAESESEDEGGEGNAVGKELTEEEQKQVQEMKQRDREVRTHEQAHMSAGGGLAGAASYEYQSGPDGQKYAVGGEVPISTRGGGTPEQQLRDAETVKRAAMAPAEPSSQDRAVAAQASADINRLRGEVAEARRNGGKGADEAGQAENGQADEAASGTKANGQKSDENGQAFGPGEQQTAKKTNQNAMFSAYAAQAGGTDSAMNPPKAKQNKANDMYGAKMDDIAISAPKRLASNGESFGSHVLSAYATAKFGYYNGSASLARA